MAPATPRSASRLRALQVLLVIGLAGSSCYLWRADDAYYGLDIEGERILFLVDVSGSMQGRSEPQEPMERMSTVLVHEAVRTGTRATTGFLPNWLARLVRPAAERRARAETTALGAAKRELIPVLRGLDEDSHFNILLFGASVESWKPHPVPATDEHRRASIRYVEGLEASGGTPALRALTEAFDADPDILFFLSDGMPTDANPQTILDQVREWNADDEVVVHAIGLGDRLDEVFMEKLATENGGTFVHR